MSTTYLITGATGGLGRCAVEHLSEQGHQVIALGRNQKVLSLLQQLPNVQTLCTPSSETTTQAILKAVHTPVDTLWHCAALSSPTGPLPDFEEANIQYTQAVLKAAHLLNIPHIVHVSTPAVYFDYTSQYDVPEEHLAYAHHNQPLLAQATLPTFERLTASTLPLKFSSAYALTKYVGELVAAQYARQYQQPVAILRPRALIGPHDNVLLPRIMEMYQEFGHVKLPNHGQAITSPTPVPCVIQALEHLTTMLRTRQLTQTEVFNLAGQDALSMQRILAILADEAQMTLPVKNVPYALVKHLVKLYELVVPDHKQKISSYALGVVNYDMTLNMQKLYNTGFEQPCLTEPYLRQLAHKLRKG